MKATGILGLEHRAIEHLLAAMEIQAARLQSDAPIRTDFFLEAVVFLREFVRNRHQQKEEETVLVALIDAGLAKDGEPISKILAEHSKARESIHTIEKHARILHGGGTGARADLSREVSGYVSMLTDHIRREDAELFPMAERLIPADVQTDLDAEYERIESLYVEAGVHDKYYGIAERLANETYG
jgi:hemerythrin-like domain-containing protein